ncbi:MAG: Zn-ribbon domain-containing OB-fold protein [Halobacteriales archaeon]
MSEDTARDGEFDDWLDAIEGGEPYYFECPDGHGALPPCRVCPECGSTDLERTDLPASGTVSTFTTVNVAAPQFEEDTPYVTAVTDFGKVRLTGVVRGVKPEEVETGMTVGVSIEKTDTTGERVVTFRPR